MISQGFFIDMQIALTVLYLTYLLFLNGRVPHKYARGYLLSIFPISILISALKVPVWTNVEIIFTNSTPVAVPSVADVAVAVEAAHSIEYIYWGGVVLMGIWFTIGLAKTIAIIIKSKPEGGIRYINIKNSAAFSFFKTILIAEKYKHSSNVDLLIMHERCHVAQRHSFDIIYCNIVRALMWFNPCSWLILHSLRQVHEWQADERIVGSGFQKSEYINTLLGVKSATAPQMANSINYSLTKKRIIMIAKPTSKNPLRIAAILPAIVALVFSLCLTSKAATVLAINDSHFVATQAPVSVDNKLDNTLKMLVVVNADGTKHKIKNRSIEEFRTILSKFTDIESMNILKGDKAKQYGVKDGESVIEVRLTEKQKVTVRDNELIVSPKVTKAESITELKTEAPAAQEVPIMMAEEMPKFEGGSFNAFRSWCATEVKYPLQAARKGIQGRVILSFIVERDGSLSNVKVLRGVDSLLNAEAVRVVENSPKWTAGRNDGKPVRFAYTMPIDFILKK